MAKIRVIDLLNKIANGEDVPKFIEHKDTIYKYDKEAKTYYEVNQYKGIYIAFDTDELNDYVGIIEEQQDIDHWEEIANTFREYGEVLAEKFAKIGRQIDKNIKDKE